MMKKLNFSKFLLMGAGILFLYSCSWFHTNKVSDSDSTTQKTAETTSEAKGSQQPESAPPAPAATPAPTIPAANPPVSPAPAEAKAESKPEPAKPAVETPIPGGNEVDYSHITLPPGPDERPLTKEEIAKIPPSEAIYLSGRGVMAGKGDPNGFAGDANKAGLFKHPLALEVSDLPKDQYGLVNWADALRQGKIIPKPSLNPEEADMPPFDLSFDIPTKSNFMPNVVYPHKIHTMWLTCINCHPAIFLMNHKINNQNMTMPKIASGEFCGRCHNRVAFPLSDCLRCHVVPKEGDKYEGNVIPGMGDVSMELCGNKGIGCPPILTPPK
ncbi:MAG: c(7)-type cytochrome triheme domain-containing protein [Nitrospiria bacterium]